MKAIAKVVSPPPALFGMVQWNRYIDQGKTISTMGMIDFTVLPPQGTRPPSKAGVFLMNKAKHTSLYLVQDKTAATPFLWRIWYSYQYPRNKDNNQKLWEQFSQKYFCCSDSNIRILLLKKELVLHSMYLYNVWREQGM
jgi:hypothetical protein